MSNSQPLYTLTDPLLIVQCFPHDVGRLLSWYVPHFHRRLSLILTIILIIVMYLNLLGLEHGVDPKTAFNSVSIKSLSYRSLTDNAT